MKTASDYIRSSRMRASNQHLNFVDTPKKGWNRFVQQPGWSNADGSTATSAPTTPAKKSMPYIVQISSASGAAVSNFDVLGAYEYLNNPIYTFDATGSLVVGSITISSGIPGVNYQQFLWQTQSSPYTVGLTYLKCTTPAAQVDEVFTIQTKDANGTQLNIPIVPNIDPYQQQNNVNVVEQEYRIDGYTKLIFNQILPMAVFTIKFFPSDNVNTARALSGSSAGRTYGDPGVIRGIR